MKKKKVFTIKDMFFVVIITSILMFFLGSIIIFRHMGGVNFSLIGNDENLKKFISAYENLLDNYYEDIDKAEVIDAAIDGMYSGINDPYTTYLDVDNSDALENTLDGKYDGIGILLEKTASGEIVVNTVYPDTPAEKAGILKNDLLLSINGDSVVGKSLEDIVTTLKSGELIRLSVKRCDGVFDYELTAENINVPALSYQMIYDSNKKVGYIHLKIFNDTADTQFISALNKLENEGMDSLILDLRGNTGGYLQVAYNISELFLENGKTIYSLKNKDGETNYVDKTSEKRNYNINVLMNKATASASEILAAALKYSYGAKLVGTTSYGKGKVQEKSDFSNGTSIKYTTAEWLTPNGDCIDGIGLTPDIYVELNKDQYDENNIYSDTQIIKALQNIS